MSYSGCLLGEAVVFIDDNGQVCAPSKESLVRMEEQLHDLSLDEAEINGIERDDYAEDLEVDELEL